LAILYLCGCNHFVSKVWTQVLGCQKIYVPPVENEREFILHLMKAEETRYMVWLELDQHIYVTIRTEVVPQD
jgi:hypothetical protein